MISTTKPTIVPIRLQINAFLSFFSCASAVISFLEVTVKTRPTMPNGRQQQTKLSMGPRPTGQYNFWGCHCSGPPDRGYRQAAAGKAAHCIPEAGYCYLAAGNPRALLHRVLFGLYSQRWSGCFPRSYEHVGQNFTPSGNGLPHFGQFFMFFSSC